MNVGIPIPKLSAGANQVVMTGKVLLLGVIVGADVASGQVEISDSATDGDEDVKVHLSGSTLKGYYEVNAIFHKGIAVDQTNQTHVTYVVQPMN